MFTSGLKKIASLTGAVAILLASSCRVTEANEVAAVQKQAASATKRETRGIPSDRLIVQLTKDADQEKFSDLLNEVHGTLIKTLEFGPGVSFLIIQTEPGTVAAVEEQFRKDRDIRSVERNVICQTSDLAIPEHELLRSARVGHLHKSISHLHGGKHALPPNDPLFPVEWDLQMLNYPAARTSQVGQATASVLVPMYFCDTGVDYQPPEIGVGAMQFNCFDPPNSTGVQEYLFDSGSHGSGTTAVTAATDNKIGLSGAANFESNRIELVMCRITNGGINTATVEGILTGLNFIYLASWLTPGPINVSVQSAPPNTLNSLLSIQTAAQQLRQKGFLVVLAAGNSAAYDSSPELYARRVLALSGNGMRASFSNYGPFQGAAPGDQVPIYVPGSVAELFGSGTSFAAPRWCAAVAVVMAALPPNFRTAPIADAIVFATATNTAEGYKVPDMQAAIPSAASY